MPTYTRKQRIQRVRRARKARDKIEDGATLKEAGLVIGVCAERCRQIVAWLRRVEAADAVERYIAGICGNPRGAPS